MSNYKYDCIKIKENIKNKRKEKKFFQKDFATKVFSVGNENGETIYNDLGEDKRTTISNWENTNNTIIPCLEYLLSICNVLDCDLDYIVGKTSIESSDDKAISDTLNISYETVRTLKNTTDKNNTNGEYGRYVDEIVKYIILNENFKKIAERFRQLSLNSVIDDVVHNMLKKKLEEKTYSWFNEYFFSAFPNEISQESYLHCIMENIPYDKFDTESFLENNFKDEGEAFIYNMCEIPYCDDSAPDASEKDKYNNFICAMRKGFLELDQLKQYEIITSAIADITYDIYKSRKIADYSKQKLDFMVSELLQEAIDNKKKSIQENMRKKAISEQSADIVVLTEL